MGKYQALYEQSVSKPDIFWAEAARDIHWNKQFEKVLDDTKKPYYRWFTGGELNTCYNALDVHIVNGRGEQTALIYDSPVTGTIKKYSFNELTKQVSIFAGALQNQGVIKGDRVIIYMPMIPEAVIAMLACARIGAIHSVVFGGFASNELAVRIDDAKPKVIISASCGIEGKKIIEYKPLLDNAIDLSEHKPEKCVIYQRKQVRAEMKDSRDIDWQEAVSTAAPAQCVPVKATDPLYILYTSGTTGMPKGVVRDNGGHAVALKWSMQNVYDVRAGDVFWAASDVGWVVGHSYIVYGPLLNGCATVLYEGKPVGTPDPGAFWRVIAEHNVSVLFTAPTAIRAVKKEDPEGSYYQQYNVSSLKYLFLAGERLDPDTYHWAYSLLKRPVIDHWWQTETGWPIVANCMGVEAFDVKPGSPSKPVPGYQVEILNSDGTLLAREQEGLVAMRLPLPPGTLPTLWQNDQKFKESYLDMYPGYFFTGDGGYIDKDGYVYIMGRVDDVINVAGHRLSTGGMEEVVARHPDVAECAVIGAADDFKGQIPLGFVVLKAGASTDHEQLIQELVQMVREQIGAVAVFKQVIIVDRLPKTRSGKILRATMRKIADGQEYNIPSTIDDPAILNELQDTLKLRGYGMR